MPEKIFFRIFKREMKNSLLLEFLAIILIGIFCLMLCILRASFIASKQNISRHYFSHVNLKSSYFFKSSTKDLTSWHRDGDLSLDDARKQPFVRAVTVRSSLQGFYQDIGIEIIGLGRHYKDVLSNFMFDKDPSLFSASISKTIAEKCSLVQGDYFSIFIPKLGETLLLEVGYIFDAPDKFIDCNNIFVSQSTLDQLTNYRYESILFRFNASPFLDLTLSNISSYTTGHIFYELTDYLKQQEKITQILEKLIRESLYVIYAILGTLMFYVQGFRIIRSANILQEYLCYHGIRNNIPIHKIVNTIVFQKLIKINIAVFILVCILCIINIPVPDTFFSHLDGLFSEYAFQIPKTIFPVFHVKILISSILVGSALFMIFFASLLRISHFIPTMFNKIYQQSYQIIFIILCIGISIFASRDYIFYNAIRAGQQSYAKQYYFGVKSIYEKNYLHNKSLGLPPLPFSINFAFLQNLQKQHTAYLTTLETLGVARLLVPESPYKIESNEKVKLKCVYIQGISGQYQPHFADIIDKTSKSKIIVGKTITDNFGKDTVLSVDIQNNNGPIKKITVPTTESVSFGVEDLDNTIFVNPISLAKELGLPPDALTKLQIGSGFTKTKNISNNNIITRSITENTKYWSVFIDNIIRFSTLKMLVMFIALSIMIYVLYCYGYTEKNTMILKNQWGVDDLSIKNEIIKLFISSVIGSLFPWLFYTQHLFVKFEVPAALTLPKIIPSYIYIYPKISSLFLVICTLGILATITIFWIQISVKKYQKSLAKAFYPMIN